MAARKDHTEATNPEFEPLVLTCADEGWQSWRNSRNADAEFGKGPQ